MKTRKIMFEETDKTKGLLLDTPRNRGLISLINDRLQKMAKGRYLIVTNKELKYCYDDPEISCYHDPEIHLCFDHCELHGLANILIDECEYHGLGPYSSMMFLGLIKKITVSQTKIVIYFLSVPLNMDGEKTPNALPEEGKIIFEASNTPPSFYQEQLSDRRKKLDYDFPNDIYVPVVGGEPNEYEIKLGDNLAKKLGVSTIKSFLI